MVLRPADPDRLTGRYRLVNIRRSATAGVFPQNSDLQGFRLRALAAQRAFADVIADDNIDVRAGGPTPQGATVGTLQPDSDHSIGSFCNVDAQDLPPQCLLFR